MAKAPKVLDNPIAWVCQAYEDPTTGQTEVKVVREGMTREEIIREFPPVRQGQLDFCRQDLVKAIIYEAYREVEAGAIRERNNVRGFWYERLMHTLLNIMGEPGDVDNLLTLKSAINVAWKDLIEDGWATYAALNIYSEKEDAYHVAVCEDSPYPGAIVMVEKEALFDTLHDLADIYGISFVATGGQNSRAAALAYVADLRRRGVDLTQTFTVYSFADFDPEGWDIPTAFIEHLYLRIPGDIQLVRLGLLKEQLGESVIKHQAIPYSLEANSEQAQKGKVTKYERFEEETGGLYIPDATGQLVPARVELNIYQPSQIREKIIAGLAEHLDGFQYQVDRLKGVIEGQFGDANKSALDELMEEWDYRREPDPRLAEIEEEIDDLRCKMAERTTEEDDELSDLCTRRDKIRGELQRRIRNLEKRFEREQALLEQRYDRYIREVNIKVASELMIPVTDRIDELREIKWKKTSDLRQQISDLEREWDGIEEGESILWNAQRDSYAWSIGQWYAKPDDVISSIERNNGWQNWLVKVEIEEVDLEEAGRERNTIDWEPTWSDKGNVRAWLKDILKSSAKA